MNRSMRLLLGAVAVGAVIVLVVLGLTSTSERDGGRGAPSSARAAALPGAGDPDKVLKDIPAGRFPDVLERLRPRPVMVDFWASWCDPCRFEMPFITSLRAKYLGRIDFIGVNYQDGREPAAAFVREFKINFPSYRDPDGKIGDGQGGIIGMPTAIFLDGRGREIHRQTGAFATEAKMEEVLRRLL
jgi:cytochrome c biogenesis protein CcmG/thiol:disulfide interchange protein DsbE